MKLQRFEIEGDGVRWFFHCAGCKRLHSFVTDRPAGSPGPNWVFENGDVERPTFSPSLLMYTSRPREGVPDDPDYDMKPADWVRVTLCHLFLRDGVIEFLDDCDHRLRGQKVPLADIPDEDLIR